MPKPEGLRIGGSLEVGGESRSDRRAIHGVGKGLHGHQPELPRLVLREATSESWFPRFRFRIDSGLGSLLPIRCFVVVGINVVWLGRPAEDRSPPAGGRTFPTILVGPAVAGAGRSLDDDRADGGESRGHFEREREREKGSGDQNFLIFQIISVKVGFCLQY